MKKHEVTAGLRPDRIGRELPAERVVGPLAIRDVPPLPDPEAAVAPRSSDPIGTPPLREIARGGKTPAS